MKREPTARTACSGSPPNGATTRPGTASEGATIFTILNHNFRPTTCDDGWMGTCHLRRTADAQPGTKQNFVMASMRCRRLKFPRSTCSGQVRKVDDARNA
jgi:hypothetical protein